MEIRIRIDDRIVRFVKGVFSRRFMPFLVALVLVGVTVALVAEPFLIPFAFKAGDVISSAQMNANFTEVEDRVNAIQGIVETMVLTGGGLWSLATPDIYYDAGNVGIGTSTPSELLSVVDNTSNYHIQLGYDSTRYWNLGQNTADFRFSLYNMNGVTGVERVSITPDGKVGIGTTSPAQMLDVNGIVRASRVEDTNNSSYYIDPDSNSNLNGAIFRGWITGGANGVDGYFRLLDATANIKIALNPSDLAYSWINCWRVGIGTSTPLEKLQIGVSGDGTKGLANSWATFSDVRFKENIREVDHALEKMDGIAGYYYNSTGQDRSRKIGVIAQEVEEVFPEVVSTDAGGYKSVDYGRLTAVLIEAVKELKSENELLKQRFDDLETALR